MLPIPPRMDSASASDNTSHSDISLLRKSTISPPKMNSPPPSVSDEPQFIGSYGSKIFSPNPFIKTVADCYSQRPPTINAGPFFPCLTKIPTSQTHQLQSRRSLWFLYSLRYFQVSLVHRIHTSPLPSPTKFLPFACSSVLFLVTSSNKPTVQFTATPSILCSAPNRTGIFDSFVTNRCYGHDINSRTVTAYIPRTTEFLKKVGYFGRLHSKLQ